MTRDGTEVGFEDMCLCVRNQFEIDTVLCTHFFCFILLQYCNWDAAKDNGLYKITQTCFEHSLNYRGNNAIV